MMKLIVLPFPAMQIEILGGNKNSEKETYTFN